MECFFKRYSRCDSIRNIGCAAQLLVALHVHHRQVGQPAKLIHNIYTSHKNKQIMKYIFLFFSIVFFACSNDVTPDEKVYWVFYPVESNIDSEPESVKFKKIDRALTEDERLKLIEVLEEQGKDFKVCTDGTVLVNMDLIPDIKTMWLIYRETVDKVTRSKALEK